MILLFSFLWTFGHNSLEVLVDLRANRCSKSIGTVHSSAYQWLFQLENLLIWVLISYLFDLQLILTTLSQRNLYSVYRFSIILNTCLQAILPIYVIKSALTFFTIECEWWTQFWCYWNEQTTLPWINFNLAVYFRWFVRYYIIFSKIFRFHFLKLEIKVILVLLHLIFL